MGDSRGLSRCGRASWVTGRSEASWGGGKASQGLEMGANPSLDCSTYDPAPYSGAWESSGGWPEHLGPCSHMDWDGGNPGSREKGTQECLLSTPSLSTTLSPPAPARGGRGVTKASRQASMAGLGCGRRGSMGTDGDGAQGRSLVWQMQGSPPLATLPVSGYRLLSGVGASGKATPSPPRTHTCHFFHAPATLPPPGSLKKWGARPESPPTLLPPSHAWNVWAQRVRCFCPFCATPSP